ncbi:hypothetical protein, partial [Adlercreutzia sp. DFI.6.23]|uniref:hypothetical protein n=1 Tax=Adlercreutzia sp. DFI.6.23 TaxID=2963705 RepID=UPI00210CAE8C
IAVSADGGAARVVEKRPVEDAPSVFFPGCSMVNYAPALGSVMADYLAGAGIAQGVSLLCCGNDAMHAGPGKGLAHLLVNRVATGRSPLLEIEDLAAA